MYRKTHPDLLEMPEVAIGGLGGSGTRLIASIVREFGVNIGGILNGPLDNLVFTLLFKRPRWFSQFPEKAEIEQALDLFHAHMTGDGELFARGRNHQFIEKIVLEIEAHPRAIGADREVAEKLFHPFREVEEEIRLWGWKEPNTHIFLPEIITRYPDIKYIHVIRNGLDMAFSGNQQQLFNWNQYICGRPVSEQQSLPPQSLAYWIESTNRAVKIGTERLGGKFMLLNYDCFCQQPEESIDLMVNFLGREIDPEKKQELAKAIAPQSIGRFRDEDISQFTAEQMDAVVSYGFECE